MAGSALKEPFHAKATTTGNSRALQLEAALVRAHPELATGRFDVHVVAPGRFLIVSTPASSSGDEAEEEDPLLSTFLAFLNGEMQRSPALLRPLTVGDVREMDSLVRDVVVDDRDADLGDDFVMP
jgi:antitoxin PrlF